VPLNAVVDSTLAAPVGAIELLVTPEGAAGALGTRVAASTDAAVPGAGIRRVFGAAVVPAAFAAVPVTAGGVGTTIILGGAGVPTTHGAT
jgi:hypothetical protein